MTVASRRKQATSAKTSHTRRSRGAASHLYTDDNPATTLHGTGFKDAATARRTIELVAARSLTYQFQTINTMLHRALGHAHPTPGIRAAIPILREWTDGYAARKAALRRFPLLDKARVRGYLERIDSGEFGSGDGDGDADGEREQSWRASLVAAEQFARVYVDLAARKRLANTLVDDKHPEREDWEVRRDRHLYELVPEGKTYTVDELWVDERTRVPTETHLVMLLWAYSPSKRH